MMEWARQLAEEEAGDLKPNGHDPDSAFNLSLNDFYAYMPTHSYIFVPTRERWPASSVNSRIQAVKIGNEETKMACAASYQTLLRIGTKVPYTGGANRRVVMAVYGYCRVSTDEQARDGNSLPAQERRIAGFAMQEDWAVDETFVERGVSGSMPLADRPEGGRLLAAVKSGDIIITPRMDRMFRSSTDALNTLEKLKNKKLGGLYMLDLPGGNVLGNGIGKLVFTILAAVADNERERIRERISEVKRDMAARGLHSGGERPFGYHIVRNGKERRLIPNKEEQRIIAEMRRARERGDSYRAIGSRFGKPPMTVRRILLRETTP